jgi:hypothetical protein
MGRERGNWSGWERENEKGRERGGNGKGRGKGSREGREGIGRRERVISCFELWPT